MQSDIVQRLRATSQGMRSHYKVGAVELIPTHTMDEAAAEITRLTEALRAAEEREKGLRAFRDRVVSAVEFVEPIDKRARNADIAADLKSGMSLRKAASKHGTTVSIVRGVARKALKGPSHD